MRWDSGAEARGFAFGPYPERERIGPPAISLPRTVPDLFRALPYQPRHLLSDRMCDFHFRNSGDDPFGHFRHAATHPGLA